VIGIITRTSDAGESPTIRRINPKLAVGSVMAHDGQVGTTH
jgi:hypothetical protein